MPATDCADPLDRPVWSALTERQAGLAIGDARAVRFRAPINLFGAAADATPESLAALAGLVPAGGTLGLVEPDAPPPLPGLVVQSAKTVDQMVLTALDRRAPTVEIVPLGADDVPEMLALTALTKPGPFFAETYLQGGYLGVRHAGALVAMAGQRLQPPGFTEVSAVCTHPDHRGKGLARALMEAVIEAILARGESAILHTYPDNPAVGLYRALGFRVRRTMVFTVLGRAG
jgi:predicted GNAT family acetyltransferase